MTPPAVNLRLAPPTGATGATGATSTTGATGELVPGRGFYQLEEDALYVQVGCFDSGRRYFSHLESEHLRLEFDHSGRLIFIELNLPRRRWTVDDRISPSPILVDFDIRWLDFRESLPEPTIRCDQTRRTVCIGFPQQTVEQSVRLAERVVVDVTSDSKLANIWVIGIVDDMAGREIAAFRKKRPRQK